MDNGTLNAGTKAQRHNGTMDKAHSDSATLDNAQWDVGPVEPRVPGQCITGHCGNETMGHWDAGKINNAAMDQGTNETIREAIDNGTMDVGTLETRTMGPWDNENGTVGH
jgi:hypothetical protein